MNPTTRRTLTMAIAPLLVLAACGGDEYTEDGQLVEKTNVRVVGVDFGPAVDSQKRVTNETDEFAPNDTIYASVRTKGASPKTVLGVRWKNPVGDDISMNNIAIRPTGDTATLFALYHLVDLTPGRYTLDMRVNGEVVKTADFTVSTTAERHPAPPREISQEPQTTSQKSQTRASGIRPFVRKTFARLTIAATSFFDRTRKDQSPFEWRRLRAGMPFSMLNRLSQPGTPWKCTPFFLSAVGLERNIALESDEFSAGHVRAMADTVGHRVFNVSYSISWMPPDTGGRVDFERELTALAVKWDNMPGVIRHPAKVHEGPSFAAWETSDSVWSAKIFYYQGAHGSARPDGFEIEEIHWGERLQAEIPDSIKGQMHNPESPYYRNQKPNGGCDALLQSP